jgi:hypothetical protein
MALTHKEMSSRGGLARKAKLTPERRSEIARKAGKARQRITKLKSQQPPRQEKSTG